MRTSQAIKSREEITKESDIKIKSRSLGEERKVKPHKRLLSFFFFSSPSRSPSFWLTLLLYLFNFKFFLPERSKKFPLMLDDNSQTDSHILMSSSLNVESPSLFSRATYICRSCMNALTHIRCMSHTTTRTHLLVETTAA